MDFSSAWGWLRSRFRSGTRTRPSYTEAEIAAAELAMRARLPEAYRSSLAVAAARELGVYELLTLDAVVASWRDWVGVDRDLGDDAGCEAVGPVRATRWYQRAWIPFAQDGGGNALVLDLDPAGGGAVGQVVTVFTHSAQREVIAASFERLLAERSRPSRWTWAHAAADVARAAATASGAVLPVPHSDLGRAGDIVTATVVGWDLRGIALTARGQSLHVGPEEIAWTHWVFRPDPSIARVGDDVPVQLLAFRVEDLVWACSLRRVHPERDPLTDERAFAPGTRVVGRVLFVEDARIVFRLAPSGMEVALQKRWGEHKGLAAGTDVELVIQSFDHSQRAIVVAFPLPDEVVSQRAQVDRLDRARDCLAAGDVAMAHTLSSDAVEEDPRSVEALLVRSAVLEAAGEIPSALNDLRVARTLAVDPVDHRTIDQRIARLRDLSSRP